MRRAVFLSLLLLPVTALAAPEPDRAEVDRAEVLRAGLSAAADGPVTIRGDLVLGAFPVEGAEPVEAARRFLDAQAGVLGLDGVAWVTSREGRLGTYVRFRRELAGLPVFDGEIVVRVSPGSGTSGAGWTITAVNLDHPQLPAAVGAPVLAGDDALRLVRASVGEPSLDGRAPEVILGIRGGALVYRVRFGSAEGSWEGWVDAGSGQVIEVRDARRRVDGTGQIFDPSPVGSSGNHALLDSNDNNTADLQAEYVSGVVLPRLDGSGYLRGDWVDADQPGRANEPGLDFTYERSDDAFEEVMTYFHLDRAQDRIQTLGFVDVNNRQQVVNVNGTNQDNSWYDPWNLEMTTGEGGVDDGEDADILLHEYGHAIQDDQVPGFGASDAAAAMGEGFGDYLAASFNELLSIQVADPACVGDWDAVSYAPGPVPCLRRVDTGKHHPHDLVAGWNYHTNGEIWSAALWDARSRVGADAMDSIVFEHHFLLTASASYLDAAVAVQDSADLLYGPPVADDVRRALIWAGYSQDLTAPGTFATVVASIPVSYMPPRSNKQYLNDEDWLMVHTEPGADGIRAHLYGYDVAAGDHIYVHDGEGNLYEVLTGAMQLNYWTPDIPGDTIQIRLVTNGSGKARGLKVDAIETLAP